MPLPVIEIDAIECGSRARASERGLVSIAIAIAIIVIA
jgi:hypothetical protein